MNKLHVTLLSIMILIITAPATMMAAPAQLSSTAETKLEKAISNAEASVSVSLQLQYSSLLKSQELEQHWDEKIKALHYKNEDALISLRKQIKLIDDYRLSKLTSDVKQAKERYKPLFDSYTALNRQIDVARILGNTQLNGVLRSQADVMKIAVQLARQHIRNKEDALKVAKDSKAKITKKLRIVLSNVDPIKVRIKLEKSRMDKPKQRFTSEWRTLNDAIKKGDGKRIVAALTSLVVISKQVNEHLIKLYGHEQSINDIVIHVKSQLP